MTRQVIFLTEPAGAVSYLDRMQRGVILMMQMQRRGMLCGFMDANTQLEYAPEAPDTMPAGACEQVEIYSDKNEAGIDEYAVSAAQITIQRDGSGYV